MKTKFTTLSLMFVFCVNTFITVYAQGVSTQDSLALVDLYDSTNGPSWKRNDNWLTGPVATWFGVKQIENGRVTKIAFNGNSLNGIIPSTIGNLENLSTGVVQKVFIAR